MTAMKRTKEKKGQSRMLKKLQHKFVGIAIISLVTIVFVELFSVNLVNIYQHDSDSRSILLLIAENDGVLPGSSGGNAYNALWNPFARPAMTTETKYSTRYFVVKLHENVVTATYTQNIASVDTDTAFNYAQRIYDNDRGFGFIDLYRYYYATDPDTGNSIMVFLDFEKELVDSLTLASISFLVGLLCVALLSFPVYLLSKNALRPVRRSIEQQKQFITDAGHELKTPITIIQADADVLAAELETEDNEWICDIRRQTQRLAELTGDLIYLSRMEEESPALSLQELSLSELVDETAQSFQALARSKNRDFSASVAPGLSLNGDEKALAKLVSILLDNAMKYSPEGGSVKLTLEKVGKNARLVVKNSTLPMQKGNADRLFERFAREDSSRNSQSGGFGLGLAIAKAVTEAHKGKIHAESEDGVSLTVAVELPLT